MLAQCTPEKPAPLPPSISPLTDTTLIDLAYGSNASQKLNLGLPAGRTINTPLVVMVHGGGWSAGDKNELTWLLNGLKQRGFVVANINYRLTLNTADNYTMQLNDLASAIQFSLQQATIYTFNNSKIYLVGHSAGAHLGLSYTYSRNTSGMVKAVGSLAGPTDLFNMAYYNFNLYNPLLQPYLGMPLFPATPAATQRYKDVSPFYQANATVAPSIFLHGELDIIVNVDQSKNMAAKLGTLGVAKKLVTYPFTFHDWWLDGAKVKHTLDELAGWFNAYP